MFEKLKFLFLAFTLNLPESVASGLPDIKSSQIMINQLDYETGPADGIVGPKTTEAITRYLNEKGMKIDGQIKQTKLGS